MKSTCHNTIVMSHLLVAFAVLCSLSILAVLICVGVQYLSCLEIAIIALQFGDRSELSDYEEDVTATKPRQYSVFESVLVRYPDTSH